MHSLTSIYRINWCKVSYLNVVKYAVDICPLLVIFFTIHVFLSFITDEKAMETILKCDLISQLIYVSCAADNPVAMRNFIQLTNQPRKATHKPFNLSKIKPVDLFPKTRHCELLLVFDR